MNIRPRRLSGFSVLLLALVVGAPTAAAHSLAVDAHSTAIAATQSPPGTVRLMAVGDVMLGQTIGRRIKRNGLLAPWLKVKQYFAQAYFVVANLECVISDRGTKWPKTFTFRTPIAAAASLAAAGIDAVTVANNHAIDYGRDAFSDTLQHLDDAGVGHFGGGANVDQARAPLIIDSNGLSIAFLGYALPFSGRLAFNTRQWDATSTTSGLALGTPAVVAADVRG